MKATFKLDDKAGKMKMFNAKSSATGSLRDYIGKELEVTGLLCHEDMDLETGEQKNITSIFLKDGSIIGGQSATIFAQTDDLIDMVSDMDIENEPIVAELVSSKSNNGREFLQLRIISL